MTKRIDSHEIEYCNSECSHFYHNYKDHENIWCDLLDRKIFEDDGYENDEGEILYDSRKREIPKDCQLPIALENCPLFKGGGTIENETRYPYTVDQWVECPLCKGTGEIISQNNGSTTKEE